MRTRWIAACVAALTGVALLAGCQEPATGLDQQYVYTVQAGDSSFQDVAERVYGDAGHAAMIEKANPAVKGADLKPGTELVVPPLKGPGGRMVAPMECSRKPVY